MTFESDHEVSEFPDPSSLFWILFPALAIAELCLGIRYPRVVLHDRKDWRKEPDERTYYPCPHCNAYNDSRFWAGKYQFGHWFGYLCPECDGRIPMLWNWTSLIVLWITYPIRIAVRRPLEQRCLARQRRNLRQLKLVGFTKWSDASISRRVLTYSPLITVIIVMPQIINWPIELISFIASIAIGFLATLLVSWVEWYADNLHKH